MAPLSRNAPGSRAALLLVFAAAISRLPVFPSIGLTRAQHAGGGGDSIAWSLRATTLADHRRYEQSWAAHREGTAFLLDAMHPCWLLVLASALAFAVLALARRLPLRLRARCERSVRHANVWAYGFFAIVALLRGLLALGVVQGPRRLLLGLVGGAVVVVLAAALRGHRTGWAGLVLRTLLTLGLGVPLIGALLALFAIVDGRHLAHVPVAWATGLGAFFAGRSLFTVARQRLSESKLR